MPASSELLFSRLLSRARLKHLQLIVGIAELQSLHKAASVIGLSQPAATHALAEFETLLGTPFFERHARGMRPSVTGAALLPMVRDALRLMRACAETVSFMQGGATGLVRIGAIAAAVSGWLARALPSFSAANPDVVIEVHEVPADDLQQMMEARRVDLVLCREPHPLPENQVFTPVVADRHVVACRIGHPLARRHAVSDKDLADATWLIPPLTGIAPREFAELAARLGGMPRTCQVSSRSVLLTKAMLDSGDLLALIPYNFIRSLVDARQMGMVSTQPIALTSLGILTHVTEGVQSPAVSRVIDSLKAWSDL